MAQAAIELGIACFEHQAHPAFRELVGQLVLELVENVFEGGRGPGTEKSASLPMWQELIR